MIAPLIKILMARDPNFRSTKEEVRFLLNRKHVLSCTKDILKILPAKKTVQKPSQFKNLRNSRLHF